MIMKKTIFGLAACGLLLSSCSSNDVFEDNQGTNNPNVINFSATTTRATINNLDNVKGGFPVYAVKTVDQNKDWHIQGAIYENKSGSWLWNTTVDATAQKWPELAMFPMNFYAYYPATHPGYSKHGATGSEVNTFIQDAAGENTLTSVITIQPTAANQADYLAANNTGIVRPQTTVPLRFNHITTKINFGVQTAAGTKSYIQQMNINNVKNTGTYDYVADPKGSNYTPWNITQTEVPGRYDYYGTVPATDNVKSIKDFTRATEEEESAAPFYDENSSPKASAAHLMLLPQSGTPVWVPTVFGKPVSDNQTEATVESPAGKTITPLKAYIGSVYRMTSADGNTDLVGYTNASNHPNYKGSAAATATPAYNGPLFVKVGFPLNTGFFWTMGKAYTYNISLGGLYSTGGYLLDNRYYDENGRPTDLLIGGTDPGEPVSGGTINFDVTVGEWDEQTATPIQ